MTFRERVFPPLPVFVLLCLLAGSFGLILVPLSTTVAALVGTTIAVLAGLVQYLTAPVLEVEDGWFRAGTARIEGHFLGEVEVLDRAGMRTAMGTGADLRAYTVYRDHTSTGIRVALVDERDPAPYWLVSSRNAPALAEALSGISGR
nr:DUF3093 domain-containing protein [Actinomycetales bacterium]